MANGRLTPLLAKVCNKFGYRLDLILKRNHIFVIWYIMSHRSGFNCTPVLRISAIDCDDVAQIENGYRSGNVFRYPHSVSFGCYPGYTIQGNEIISCQDTGEWSGDPPTCNGMASRINSFNSHLKKPLCTTFSLK